VVVALLVEGLDADAHQVTLAHPGPDGVDNGGKGLLGVGARDAHELDLVHGLDHPGGVYGGLRIHDLDAPLLEGLGVQVRQGGAVDAERLLLHPVVRHEAGDLVDGLLDDRVVRTRGGHLGE